MKKEKPLKIQKVNDGHSSVSRGSQLPHMRRKKAKENRSRFLLKLILIVFSAAVLSGLLLVVLPLFRVGSITVEGNQRYSAEEIISAAGIAEGDELFGAISAVKSDGFQSKILKKCVYLESVSASCGLFGVKYSVTEKEDLMYFRFNRNYYSFDKQFRVLEKSESEDTYSDFMKVKMPYVESLSVGGNLHFPDDSFDTSYIGVLLDFLRQKGFTDRISYIDFSDKFAVSFVLDDFCKVELGKTEDLENKFAAIFNLTDGKDRNNCMTLDVSNPQKPVCNDNIERDALYN